MLGALPAGLLDATVYRECPECGGSRKRKDSWAGATREVACPACTETPVAIVSAELREKAVVAFGEVKKYQRHKGMTDSEALDLILSTVLGQVRYAKEVWCLSAGGEVWPTTKESHWLERGDSIAVLEEAGKEE